MVQQMMDVEDPAQKRATRKLLFASLVCIGLAVISAAIAIAVILQENEVERIPHTNYVEKQSQQRSSLKTENRNSLLLVPSLVVNGHSLQTSSFMHVMTSSILTSSLRNIQPSSFSLNSGSNASPSSYSEGSVFHITFTPKSSDLIGDFYSTISSPSAVEVHYLSTELSDISYPSKDILYGSTESLTSIEMMDTVLSQNDLHTDLSSKNLQPFSTSVEDMLNSLTAYSDIIPTMTSDPYLMTEIFTNISLDSTQNLNTYSDFTNYQHVDTSALLGSSTTDRATEAITGLQRDKSTSFMSPYLPHESDIGVSHAAVSLQLSTESDLALDSSIDTDFTVTDLSPLSKEQSVSFSSTAVKSNNYFTKTSEQSPQHGLSNSFIASKPRLASTAFSSSDLVPFATSFKRTGPWNSITVSPQWSSVQTTSMESLYNVVSPSIFPDCSISQFRCSSGQCVDYSRRCDRVIHCEDMSDEINCSYCQGFQCGTGLCLWSWNARCNQRVECIDLSDEIGCDHGASYKLCDNGMAIPLHQWCDSVDNCHDNSDELNCTCSFKEISCSDGRCIREEWICDSHVDCVNSTDEKNCDHCSPDQYICKDYNCINTTQICDGVQDCPGAEDESRCYDIKQVASMTVQYKGDNYTVCSTNWHSGISDYICQLLGYRNSSVTNYTSIDSEFDKLELNQSLTDYNNLLLNMNIRSSCTSNLTVSVSCMPRDCGVQSPDLMLPFVASGDIASAGQWPWVVSLSYLGRPFCSGTLISSDWVVTAGHCIAVSGSYNYTETPQYVEIVLGAHQRLRNKGTAIRSDRIVHHPELRMSGIGPIYNDIALIHLSQPITFTDHIAPVCLPDVDFSALSNCYIAGWGYIGTNQDVTVQDLRSAKLNVLSDGDCQSNTVHMEDKVNTNITYCTLYKFGTMSGCQGDSGSPLMCQDNTGHWILAGVMSSGASQCGVFSNTANRFTRVPAMLSWIYSVIQN